MEILDANQLEILQGVRNGKYQGAVPLDQLQTMKPRIGAMFGGGWLCQTETTMQRKPVLLAGDLTGNCRGVPGVRLEGVNPTTPLETMTAVAALFPQRRATTTSTPPHQRH